MTVRVEDALVAAAESARSILLQRGIQGAIPRMHDTKELKDIRDEVERLNTLDEKGLQDALARAAVGVYAEMRSMLGGLPPNEQNAEVFHAVMAIELCCHWPISKLSDEQRKGVLSFLSSPLQVESIAKALIAGAGGANMRTTTPRHYGRMVGGVRRWLNDIPVAGKIIMTAVAPIVSCLLAMPITDARIIRYNDLEWMVYLLALCGCAALAWLLWVPVRANR